ncbi:MAG: hypothetical protein ACFFC7_12085 [Candidatus Hermodarchaeota archaeon]
MVDKNQDSKELHEQSPAHKDFITFRPLPVKYIQQEEFEMARKYNPIIRALRNQTMTVKEIHSFYRDPEKDRPVSIKTIYQILKRLEEKGLVAVAGRRMTEDSRLTEKLYAATAKVFFLDDIEANRECLESERGRLEAQILNNFMSEVFQVPEADSSVFYNYLCRLHEMRSEINTKLRERLNNSEKMPQYITKLSTEDFIELWRLLLMLGAFYKEPKLLENLQNMFKVKN